MNFNSIKVRLKLAAGGSLLSGILFQFHKGTIKTQLANVSPQSVGTFQFHKGTIKTSGRA